MELEEKRDHAARLLGTVIEDPEYSFVYEDDELMDEPEEVQREIHDLMATAIVTVTWPGMDDYYVIAGEEDE